MVGSDAPEITLVTEAYNLAEGQGWDELVNAVATIGKLARAHDAETILTDPSGDPRIAELVASHAGLRYLAVPGATYDEQKLAAARSARGTLLVFLDGDCRPAADDWLPRLLAPLRAGSARAVGGQTFYDDFGPRGIACTIMDFGVLWDAPGGDLGCYSSNNCAFDRDLFIEVPPGDGGMRCNCYAHAQALIRRGTPVRHVPEALVLHELPDVAKERARRGRELVVACWADPLLRETAWLAPGHKAAMRFIDDVIHADAQRFHTAPAALGLGPHNALAVEREILALRELDYAGVLAALAEGEADGRNARARAEHAAFRAAQQSCATPFA